MSVQDTMVHFPLFVDLLLLWMGGLQLEVYEKKATGGE